ncbi:unnamed protein product, partial [Allacma fusca]
MENITLPIIDPPYQTNFEFEKFDYFYWRQWMDQRWWWSVGFATLYLFSIVIGKFIMRDREPFKLKRALLLWNSMLAIYSTMSVTRTLPEVLSILGSTHGFHTSICLRDQMTMSHVFWEFIGTWSKVVELGDTFFVILRKQPLILLHWYHHASVLVYTWFSIDANDPAHRWYMIMNTGIHSLMYNYYALRAMGINIPRKFALCLTTVQILQMFMGFYVNLYSVFAI